MFESLFAIFVAIFVGPYAIAALILLAIFFERNSTSTLTVFVSMIAATAAFMYFGLSLNDLLWYGIGYVLVGLVWSFFRYKRFLTDKTETELVYCKPNMMKSELLSGH